MFKSPKKWLYDAPIIVKQMTIFAILFVVALASTFVLHIVIFGHVPTFTGDPEFVGTLIMFFLLGILAIFLIYAITGRIISEIVSIKNLASGLLRGDVVGKIRAASKDELGDLAATLNLLSDDITNTRLQLTAKQKEIEGAGEEVKEEAGYLERTKVATLNLLEDLEDAKRELEEGRIKDDIVLSSIGDGLIVVDELGRLTRMNQRAEDMLGWMASELTGKVWIDAVSLQHQDGSILQKSDRPIEQAFETKQRVSILPLVTPAKTYYIVRKNGTRFPIEIVASPLILENKVIGVVAVFRDVTKEKEIEKVKTDFVSIASHQLRTPLSTINWYSEILLAGDAGPVNGKQREYLDEISKGNQRMIDLVNALLNVSRLEVGAFTIESAELNLKNVVEDTLKEIAPQAAKKKLKITSSYDRNLPKVQADYNLVKMIFQNLISNSIKYTPAGGKIDVLIALDDVDRILIKVSDNGMGIPKMQQDKIFTKLFRADNVREADPEGTGLGLYIIKSIIDQTNGKIWFESEENKGTTFFISAPVSWMQPKAGTKRLV